MAREPVPSQPWSGWSGEPELSRSWPSVQDIDVDRTKLKKIGLEMQDDAGMTLKQGEALYGQDVRDGWKLPVVLPEQFDALRNLVNWEPGDFTMNHWLFGNTANFLQWDSLVRLDYNLMGLGEAIRDTAVVVYRNYSNIGSLALASGVNYDRAEGLFDSYRPATDWLTNRQDDGYATLWTKEPWVEEDVSRHDAPAVKFYLDSGDWNAMSQRGTLCSDLASLFVGFQQTVEDRARQFSDAWPGRTSEYAHAYLRVMHADARVLAYACGATGQALSWLSGRLMQYQAEFESTVKLGDLEIDDDLPNWMWPSGGGAHDRARDYLREVNRSVAVAHEMLPDGLDRVSNGGVDASPAVSWYQDGKLQDGYWGELEAELRSITPLAS
ncbi:hypothetical protein [Nonomuraea sp. NPDC049400]|uniref:hypothetical protein n=1 Tax=Nonomuraea sp. NPDC049400 TaxID=3364352 RepID=UPI0037ABADD8